MKTVLHRMKNGGVGNYPPNPKVLAMMTGGGFGWNDERIAWEIFKFTIPSEAVGWAGFSEEFAVEWVTALAFGGLTEDEAIGLFARRVQLRHNYIENVVVESTVLPSQLTGDRSFRDAVVWDDAKANRCRCDMPKARVIHMNRIRKVRNEELKKLDVPFMKALESGDVVEQQSIATQKQLLRDIPQTFSLSGANAPNQLKALWPPGLPDPA